MSGESESGQRLDRWLWFARFFKSRTLATRFVSDGHLRANTQRVVKAHHIVHVADVLTFAQGSRVRVIRVAAIGDRRGPASEARLLYEDLDPPPAPRSAAPEEPAPAVARATGSGRPTKAERRALDRLRDRR